MKKIIYSSLLVLAITLLPSACDNDSDMNSPHGSTTPPEQVVLNGVKNLPGKSIIYFTQPSDKNFLYMKAVYMTEIGERSTNASYFADSVVVEGFEKAGEYNVKLYSVSPGEAYSEPLEVKINPEEPPYITAYKEMEIKPDFAKAYAERGRAKNLKGDKEGAFEDLKKSIELNPEGEEAKKFEGQHANFENKTCMPF